MVFVRSSACSVYVGSSFCCETIRKTALEVTLVEALAHGSSSPESSLRDLHKSEALCCCQAVAEANSGP